MSTEISSPMNDPWVIAAFAIFGIHGMCYFRIRYLLRKAGVRIKLLTSTADAISQYRQYYREAPTKNWPRGLVYISVVSLLTSFAMLLLWVLQGRP